MLNQDEVERGSFLEALGDPDAQVRLNAAVRLAYLKDHAGADELLVGLASDSVTVRLIQVPDALHLVGGGSLDRLRDLASRPGIERVPAARTLALLGHAAEAIAPLIEALSSGDYAEVDMAVLVAGELGAAVQSIAPNLEAIARATPHAWLLMALVSVSGASAVPTVMAALESSDVSERRSACRALTALGSHAEEAGGALIAHLEVATSLRESIDVARALLRVARPALSVPTILDALSEGDRWLRIGLLRQLVRTFPRCMIDMEQVAHWPPWEARLLHADPAALDEEAQSRVVAAFIAFLNDDDFDLRRNAALGLSLCAPTGEVIRAVERTPRIIDELRLDVLAKLDVDLGHRPAYDPTLLPMRDPPWDIEAVAGECERAWASADGGDLDYHGPVPKWQFLQYLIERHHVMLHGSRVPGLDELRPLALSATGNQTAGQPGLFGVDHALMAMYFAIVDRTKLGFLSNAIYPVEDADGTTQRLYHLGADYTGLGERPFIDATVYVLPSATFSMYGEWTSLSSVRPLSRLAVSPEDFPHLEFVWGSDLSGLDGQFGDELPFLRDVGFWATKRSDRSAHE